MIGMPMPSGPVVGLSSQGNGFGAVLISGTLATYDSHWPLFSLYYLMGLVSRVGAAQ